MDALAYDAYTQNLVNRLDGDVRVLGLVALGSMAERTLRDVYSDHDFWLVVAAGAEPHFLSDLGWLPPSADPLTVVHFGTRGASVLYADRHVTEFAVFTEASLTGQPTDRYALLLDRADLAARLPSLVASAQARRAASDQWPDAIGNLALVVWTGVQRHRRGEFLASQKYLRHHAVDTLLGVAQAAGLLAHTAANFLDPWRRLERVHPRLADGLLASFAQPTLEAARMLLDLAETELRPHTQAHAWTAVETVRRWLAEPGAS